MGPSSASLLQEERPEATHFWDMERPLGALRQESSWEQSVSQGQTVGCTISDHHQGTQAIPVSPDLLCNREVSPSVNPQLPRSKARGQMTTGALLALELFLLLLNPDSALGVTSRGPRGAQWLRIHLPMQGTRVRALAREDATCRRPTKPVRHNY